VLACRLDVFDAAERRRCDRLREQLGQQRLGIQALADGIAVLYPGERMCSWMSPNGSPWSAGVAPS
jgi:hypothetical protein